MNHPFKGAGVALVTPFTEENKIDFEALGKVIENQVKGGMDYLVALGTTAETPTLSGEEKKEVVKFIKENSAGLPVVVGMGGNDTRKIIKQIEKFDFDGVAGLLIVTPYYNKPSQDGMIRHYSAIAKASPSPIILYNVPSRTGVNMEYETVVRLAETSEKQIYTGKLFCYFRRRCVSTADHFSWGNWRNFSNCQCTARQTQQPDSPGTRRKIQ
jgi:4-hydroxy-tetrahydrodipicolinate synthase